MNVILDKNIEELGLNYNLTSRLKESGLLIVKDLWKMKRNELKKIGFTDNEISQIIIKLQLNVIDLNKRVY